MSAPAVSVIVAVYNKKRFIASTLRSVLRQTFRDFEIVVVDDGSDDGSDGAVRALRSPNVRLIRFPKNRGPARARNAALRASRGRWIAFLDADDLWRPDKLAVQVPLLERGAEFCHSDLSLRNARGKVTLRRHVAAWRKRNPYWIDRFPHFGMPPCTSTVAASRALLRRVGGFDPHFRLLYDDLDLWARVGKALPTRKIAFVERPLVLRRNDARGLMARLTSAIDGLRGRKQKPGARGEAALLDRTYLMTKYGIMTKTGRYGPPRP